MAIFGFFRMAASAILAFQNLEFGRTALLCQISSKSLELRPRYVEFLIFKDGGRRRLGFVKFQICYGQSGQKCRTASSRQISSKSRTAAEIWRFFGFSMMAAVRRLGFVMRVLIPPTKGIWWSLSLCKIWLESMQ